jgi:hypothetical protein
MTNDPCPTSGAPIGEPDVASHKRIVLSLDPGTTQVPSGENATDVM